MAPRGANRTEQNSCCASYPLGACPTFFPEATLRAAAAEVQTKQLSTFSLSTSTASPPRQRHILPHFQPLCPRSRRGRRRHTHHAFAQIYHTAQPIQTSRFYPQLFQAMEHRHTPAYPNPLSGPIGSQSVQKQPKPGAWVQTLTWLADTLCSAAQHHLPPRPALHSSPNRATARTQLSPLNPDIARRVF